MHKYSIGKVLGEGSFAVVREGTERTSRGKVAIKTIKERQQTEEEHADAEEDKYSKARLSKLGRSVFEPTVQDMSKSR